MNGQRRWLLSVLLACSVWPVTATAAPLVFSDTGQEARFHALTAELRCVQCQNQSLADSDALIAQDMRRQVLTLMQEGQSDSQIRAYLVQRYGQFVLYRPALSPATIALWLVPGLLLICGALLAWRVIARRQHLLAEHPLPPSGDDW
jgi:cytochrome c-type biogenesis protein CcmH